MWESAIWRHHDANLSINENTFEIKVVGDLGIEPSVRLREGVTVCSGLSEFN